MLFVYVCLECFAVLKFENNVITKVKFENTEALAENRIVDLCRLGMIKKTLVKSNMFMWPVDDLLLLLVNLKYDGESCVEPLFGESGIVIMTFLH